MPPDIEEFDPDNESTNDVVEEEASDEYGSLSCEVC